MKRTALFVLAWALGWVMVVAQQAKPAATVDRLAWLAGSWRMERAGRIVEDQWMAPAAGVMLGVSRTVTKGKVVAHEFMQIRPGPGGEWFFIAQPSGQKEAAFRVLSQTDRETVFENRQHDFPQRIGYRLESGDVLFAWIEGERADGTLRRIEFVYQRVKP